MLRKLLASIKVTVALTLVFSLACPCLTTAFADSQTDQIIPLGIDFSGFINTICQASGNYLYYRNQSGSLTMGSSSSKYSFAIADGYPSTGNDMELVELSIIINNDSAAERQAWIDGIHSSDDLLQNENYTDIVNIFQAAIKYVDPLAFDVDEILASTMIVAKNRSRFYPITLYYRDPTLFGEYRQGAYGYFIDTSGNGITLYIRRHSKDSLTIIPKESNADNNTYVSGWYEYSLQPDGTAIITKYTGSTMILGADFSAKIYSNGIKDLTIPSELDGHIVTAIAYKAFLHDYTTEKITLPDTVQYIENNPFDGCLNLSLISVSPANPSLASIDGVLYNKQNKALICYPVAKKGSSFIIPDGIQYIGPYSFRESTLSRVSIPASIISIDHNAFWSCEMLEMVELPDSVISIGDDAFGYCKKVKSVKLSNQLQHIGAGAFKACWELADITLPDSLLSIGDDCFAGCRELKAISIPANVRDIGYSPFSGCKSLTSIEIADKNEFYRITNNALISCFDKKLVQYFMAIPQKEYTIPDDVYVIGRAAFRDAVIERIIVPDGVKEIASSAFSSKSLISVDLPESLEVIGDYAFYNSTSLASITIPENVKVIGEDAFSKDTSLTVVQSSYAEQYAIENNILYLYSSSLDWLN